jgi:hypothetical protein
MQVRLASIQLPPVHDPLTPTSRRHRLTAQEAVTARDIEALARLARVRCSQAGSDRRTVGDGVAEAEKVGQEGKEAAGGGVPCCSAGAR